MSWLGFACIIFRADAQNVNIPYPQPLADSIPLIFLPNLVSKDSLDFNAAFSPDGKSFYFSRSKNRQSKIYYTRYDGTKWAEPEFAAFTGGDKYAEADPVFGPDGKLYFISNRPKDNNDTNPDYDIWFVTPQADGKWSLAENMSGVNSDSNEFYISFTMDRHLYFASSRKGGFGQEDIYVSEWRNGQYQQAENLGAAVNTAKSEYDPCISSRGDILIFASSNRDDSFGGADLYCSRSGKKRWLKAMNLGSRFNTKTREFCAAFSPDSKYFFFSSEGDVKWVAMKTLMQQINRLW